MIQDDDWFDRSLDGGPGWWPIAIALIVGFLCGALLFMAFTSDAATIWVSPSGGGNGSDSTNARTLAYANANAVAGDVVRFKSGSYGSTAIAPEHNGTANNRIRYYGFPSDRGAVRVADVALGPDVGSYSTVRWVTVVSGEISGCGGSYGDFVVGDSLVAINGFAAGDFGFGFDAHESVFDSLYITGTITGNYQLDWLEMGEPRDASAPGEIGKCGSPPCGGWWRGILNNTVADCVFNVTVDNTGTPGDVHILQMRGAAYNTIARNTFNITIEHCWGYFFPVEMYESYYNLFQANTWNLTTNRAYGVTTTRTRSIWGYRDSSSYNRFVGNTVTTSGPAGDSTSIDLGLSQSGAYGGTTNHTYIGNNVLKIHNPQRAAAYWQNGSRADTIEFNLIASNRALPALSVASGGGFASSILRHNTLWTASGTVVDISAETNTGASRFVSNVYYGTAASGIGSETTRVPLAFPMDSAGTFFNRGGTPGAAIKSGSTYGTIGSGGNFGQPGMAVWGTPAFKDSTFATLMDSIGASGYARWPNAPSLSGQFAGCMSPGDVIPPGDVTDFASGASRQNQIVLSWTAPGGDQASGAAASYDIRYSLVASDITNWNAATQASGEPLPDLAGTPQCFVLTGLSGGFTYYIGLRALDAAGNTSATSNVVTKTTPIGGSTTLLSCPL